MSRRAAGRPAAGTRVHERFAARARARRRTVLRRWTWATLAAAATVTAGWLVLGSGVLAVRSVVVTGAQRLSAAEVRAAAGVPVGSALATVDTGTVARRVAALPPVASVRVDRRWPGTLVVAVRERQPVAALTTGDAVVLLDGSAVAFATVPSRPAGVLPLRVPGPVPGPGQASARAALQVLTALPADLRAQVVALRADTPAAVTLTLRGGRQVVWGGVQASPRKARILEALSTRPARRYDVSAPDFPVTR